MSNLLSYVEIGKKIEECHGKNCRAVAFLPIGCTEQHGPFLPIQTDTIISENISKCLSGALSHNYWGYVFPAICYTPTKSNANYPGTVSVDEESLRQYVRQVCKGILKADFDALILISGHGPVDPSLNEVSFNLVHEQYLEKKTAVRPVIALSVYSCKSMLEQKFGQKPGQHADWRELLYLVHILGDNYFDETKINDIRAFQRKNTFPLEESPVLGVPIELRSVQGVIGNPTPVSENDWHDSARMAWDATIKYLADSVQSKLNNFWEKGAKVC